MKKVSVFPILIVLVLPLLASCVEQQVYVVYFGEHSGKKAFHEIEGNHHSYLLSVKESDEEAKASLVYSYKNNINGFAAVLSPDEASKLSELDEVVSVIRSEPTKYSLQTTRSWEFVGLEAGQGNLEPMGRGGDLLLRARYGGEVIVGVLDSGVWPESESFSDEGMGPIPKSWKGICQTGQAFDSSHCNRKLIGARYYLKGYEKQFGLLNTTLDYRSPRDGDGHGTHTASTVGGRRVPNASFMGEFAKGTASGGAPLAHLAIYKACWAIPGQEKVDGNICLMEDMLAAIDDAIADGVHVLSISIGTREPTPLSDDGIAIGSLHATKQNIVVACSAGNKGPAPSILSNPAPWIITVGASSLDRDFSAPVELGNGIVIEGQTVTPHKLEREEMYPLVFATNVVIPDIDPRSDIAGQCLPGSLSPEKAKGKIVVCFRGNGTRIGKGKEVKRAGGVGFILGNNAENPDEKSYDPHYLPATAVTYGGAVEILNYIHSVQKPVAYIYPGRTLLSTKPAPCMANFSSRGPNALDPYILKPDITAPGVNILAAWSGADSLTKLAEDTRMVKFNFDSGTSMACPHVAATAALLRAIHPNWSSAAIRSALMTTAGLSNNIGNLLTDSFGNPATPFQYGSGHLRPTRAAHPGLVYDSSYEDYLMYVCCNGLPNIDPSYTCPSMCPPSNELNYPSLSIPKLNGTVTVKRTVRNVGGCGNTTYVCNVKAPNGYSVNVSPSVLNFNLVGEEKSFTVSVVANNGMVSNGEYQFGWFTWTDGIHDVRSPIAVSLA